MMTGLLTWWCWLTIQELPEAPRPEPVVATATIEPATAAVPALGALPVINLEPATSDGPAIGALAATEPAVVAQTDDSDFRAAIEERIRREQPELSDAAVAEMARGILEIRARVAGSNAESTTPRRPIQARIEAQPRSEGQPLQMQLMLEAGDQPGERRVVDLRLINPNDRGPQQGPHSGGPAHNQGPHNQGPHNQGPHNQGPHNQGPQHGNPLHSGPHHQGPQQGGPHHAAPNFIPPQGAQSYPGPQLPMFPQGQPPQPGMMAAPTMGAIAVAPAQPLQPFPRQEQGTDEQFASHLRDAARRLDQGAADLEDRGAFDLADQMRQIAQQLRQQARERRGQQGPHLHQPGMHQPSMMQPGMHQPGMMQPGHPGTGMHPGAWPGHPGQLMQAPAPHNQGALGPHQGHPGPQGNPSHPDPHGNGAGPHQHNDGHSQHHAPSGEPHVGPASEGQALPPATNQTF